MVTTQLPRKFLFNDNGTPITLNDPDESMSAESILNFYSNTYPVLVTAKINGPQIVDDTLQYRFESVLGTKG